MESTPGALQAPANVPSARAAAASATGLAGATAGAALFGGWPAALVAAAALLGVPLFAVMAGGAALAFWLHGSPLNHLAPRVLDERDVRRRVTGWR